MTRTSSLGAHVSGLLSPGEGFHPVAPLPEGGPPPGLIGGLHLPTTGLFQGVGRGCQASRILA